MVVVLRRPLEEPHQCGIEHRARIEHLEDRLQARDRDLGSGRNRGNDAYLALPPEGHADPRADRRRDRFSCRGQVVEQPAQGGVERHPEDLGHSFRKNQLNQ